MLAMMILNNIQLESNISVNTVFKNTSLIRNTSPAFLASKHFYLLSQTYNYDKKPPFFRFKTSRNSVLKQTVLVVKSVFVRSYISLLFCSRSCSRSLLLVSQLSPTLAVCLMQSGVGVPCTRGVQLEAGYSSRQPDPNGPLAKPLRRKTWHRESSSRFSLFLDTDLPLLSYTFTQTSS